MGEHHQQRGATGAITGARAAARAAAERADVRTAALTTPAEMERAADLFAAVWGTSGVSTPLPHDALSGIHHAGGSVLGAFRGDELLGAAVALAGSARSTDLYGMLAGVAPGTRTRGVGAAMKQAQRVWGLETGAQTMRWTYDPFLRGNAVLNLNRLGATGISFAADFYAPISDELNAGGPADRLVVRWDLARPHTRQDLDSTASVVELVVPGDDGGPRVREDVLAELPSDTNTYVSVALPEDVVGLRHNQPALAAAWIEAYRLALPPLFASGRVAFAADSGESYLFLAPDAGVVG